MNQERVLVGISDDSDNQAVLDWVIQRAAGKSIRVVVLAARNDSRSERAEDSYLLARELDRIRSAISEVSVDVVPTTQLLLESLIERSALFDLLVVESSLRGKPSSSLTRSLPFRVAARAQCATVIIPATWRISEGPIIVGIGGDQSADRATLFAAREAIDCDCDLIVMHCWSMPTANGTVATSLLSPAEWKASHLEILHNAVDRIRAAFPKVRLRAILEHGLSCSQFAAHAGHPRLVVMGAHQRGPLTALRRGSTAGDVLRAGAVPLAIVPLRRQAIESPNTPRARHLP